MPIKLTIDDLPLEGGRDYGKYVSALCPWHEDSTPSLLVYKDGWAICLACGHSGNFYQLYQALQGWKAGVAPKQDTDWRPPYLPTELEEMENFADDAHRVLSKYIETLGWYLQERGVDDRIEPCRLGWHNGWITIPVYTRDQKFEGMILRAMPYIQKATNARFHQPHGQRGMCYVPNWRTLNESNCIFVVFGMFDALTLSSLQLPVVTTTAGKDSFKVEWMDEYRKPIIFLPDKGEETTAAKYVSKLGWRGKLVTLDYPEGMKDPADFASHGMKDALRNQLIGYT